MRCPLAPLFVPCKYEEFNDILVHCVANRICYALHGLLEMVPVVKSFLSPCVCPYFEKKDNVEMDDT